MDREFFTDENENISYNEDADSTESFSELGKEAETLHRQILEETLGQAERNIESNEPNPAYLLKILNDDMIKYLKDNPSEHAQFYLFLFNSTIELIQLKLAQGICDRGTLDNFMQAPGSKAYVAKNIGKQYILDCIREEFSRTNQRKENLSRTGYNDTNKRATNNFEPKSCNSSPREIQPGFFGKPLSRTHSPTMLSKEGLSELAYIQWIKNSPSKMDKQITCCKEHFVRNKNHYQEAGLSENFLNELTNRLPSLLLNIIDITTEYKAKIHAKSSAEKSASSSQLVKYIKEYDIKRARAWACMQLIENLDSIFINRYIEVPHKDQEKLLKTINNLGLLCAEFHPRYGKYTNITETIRKLEPKIPYHTDENNEKKFDYFIVELQKLVSQYNCKKDKVKLGLTTFVTFQRERENLSENLAMLWEIYSTQILPLFNHIKEGIKAGSINTLSLFHQQKYDQLLPLVNEMERECTEYYNKAKLTKLVLSGLKSNEESLKEDATETFSTSSHNITEKNEDFTNTMNNIHLIHNKIKLHHAHFDLNNDFLKFNKEKGKFQSNVDNKIETLINMTNRMVKKIDNQITLNHKSHSSSLIQRASMFSKLNRVNSDPGKMNNNSRKQHLFMSHESDSDLTSDSRSENLMTFNDITTIDSSLIIICSHFNKYAGIKDRIITELVPLEKGYRQLAVSKRQILIQYSLKLQNEYKIIEAAFKPMIAAVTAYLAERNLSVTSKNKNYGPAFWALKEVSTNPNKFFQCMNDFAKITQECESYVHRIRTILQKNEIQGDIRMDDGMRI